MNDRPDNEMEALARASLLVRDLAEGIPGTVVLSTPATLIPHSEEHERVVLQIYRGQMALRDQGWQRDRKVEWRLAGNHNVEVGAWKKRFPGEKAPRWVTVRVTTRFGLRAVFHSSQTPGNVPPEQPSNTWEESIL